MVVKFGIIGSGNAARKYAVPGIASHPEARVEAMTSGSASHAGIINRPDLDAVVIATPPTAHYAEARLALEAGKHVMVEKPAVTDLGQAEDLVRLAEERNLHILVHQNMRFSPAVVLARTFLADGALGQIESVDGVFEHPGPKSKWYQSMEAAGVGGSFFDLGTHLIDAVRFLTESELSPAIHPRMYPSQGIDLRAHVTYARSNGGSVQLKTSWEAPTLSGRLTLYCTNGSINIAFRPLGQEEIILYNASGINKFTPPKDPQMNAYFYFIKVLLGEVSGDPMGISLANNLPTLRAVLSAYGK